MAWAVGGALLLLLVTCAVPGMARAQIGSERYSSMVMEARSGRVISSVNPDELRHPASLTKMMTLYMTFEALRDRRISLGQRVPVSAHAASMSPTKLGVPAGGGLSVEEAILGLVTRSANDAAAALGELLGGSEARFARVMTLRARALGMRQTVFRNASGLPDPDQVTTARDMAVLGRRLVFDFPQEYKYFATQQFRFRGQVLRNHNNLLETYPGTDGIKTGYIDASGFNLVSSTMRGNVRLIGVVMGGARGYERDLHMAALLDQGFAKLDVPVMARAPGRGGVLVASAHAAPLAAPVAPPRLRRAPPRWAVQVGSFTTEAAARRAAAVARRVANDGEIRVDAVTAGRKTTHRALLGGMTQGEAQAACAALGKRKMRCVPVRPEGGQVAAR